MTKLVRIANIIEHPFSLVYRSGKNLMINGVEIYEKYERALAARLRDDYFDFGFLLGQALDALCSEAPRVVDEHG